MVNKGGGESVLVASETAGKNKIFMLKADAVLFLSQCFSTGLARLFPMPSVLFLNIQATLPPSHKVSPKQELQIVTYSHENWASKYCFK